MTLTPYRLHYTETSDWPPLAWIARCQTNSAIVEVRHGAQVETQPHWFGDAVWPGEYTHGRFDRTEIVAGGGGTVGDDGLVFVSSASTVERLHTLQIGPDLWVSNSLPCLLATVGADVDPTYPDYHRDFNTVIHGLQRYRRNLASEWPRAADVF